MKKFTAFLVLTAFCILSYSTIYAGSPRLSLCEEYTSAYCGACVSRNPALVQSLQNNINKCVPMIIHTSNGDGDPLYRYNPSASGRYVMYGSSSIGTPALWVNGKKTELENVESEIAKYAYQTSPYSIKVFEERSGKEVTASVVVECDNAVTGHKQVFIAVIEEYIQMQVQGSSESEFHWTCRKIFPGPTNGDTLAIAAGGAKTFTKKFTIDSVMQPAKIYVIAFVQDMTTKEVLQAAKTSSATNLKAEISLSSPSIDFGNVKETSTKNLIITNTGYKPLNISDMTIQDDADGVYQLISEPQQTVGYKEKCTVQVKFSPITDKNFKANLKITSNADGATTKLVPLNGTGKDVDVKAILSFSTPMLDFGKIADNKTMQLTLRNTGYKDMTITAVAVIDDPKAVFEVLNLTTPYVIKMNESKEIEVKFKPMKNTQYTANLEVTSDALGNNTVALRGEGSGVVSSIPEATLDVIELNFDNVSTSKTMPVKISNTGEGELVITKINFDCDEPVFSVDNPTAPKLKKGESYTFNVRFTPTSNDYFVGFMQILSNADNGDVSVSLIGQGSNIVKAPEIKSSVDSIKFGIAKSGTTKDTLFTVSNPGTDILTINSMTIEGDQDFSLINLPPKSIQKGENVSIEVRFAPSSEGEHHANIKIECNSKSNPTIKVWLNGMAENVKGVENQVLDNSVSISPNPAKTDINLKISLGTNVLSNVKIDLFNSNGDLVSNLSKFNELSGENNFVFSANSLSNGVYFISLKSDKYTKIIKFEINK